MPLTLLQYHIGSRTSKAEAVKQELVQTALHQGLCDIALVQGCSRTQDTVRAGVGAVFQSESSHAPLSSALGVQRVCQTGVMLFYRAKRFQAKQLALVADDLPGWTFLAVQLCDTSTGSNLIALTACTPSLAASAATAQSHEPAAAPVTPLSHLMQRLSATCPVVAAAEVTAPLGADTGLASLQQHMQICLCAPVQTATASSQAFFAALCTSPGQQVKLSNMQSVLPTPSTAVSQYIQNAHTVDCWLPHDSPESSLTQNPTVLSHHSTLEPPGNNADCITRLAQAGSASVRLQNLIAAAEEGACSVTEGAPDAEAREQADTAGSQHRLGSVQHEASSSSQTEVVEPSAGTVPQSRKADCSQGSQPGQVSITASSQIGRWVRGLTPTPLVTNHQTAGQAWASEIEPKALTPRPARDLQQLIQTNSGNLAVAANRASDPLRSRHSQDSSGQQTSVTTFQLQPRPNREHAIDVSAMRIMQLQRNASQVSEGDSELTADEKAVLAQELADPATSLSELRFRTALGPSQAFDQQLGLSEGCDASGEGISEADDGSGPGRHQSDDTDSSSDGLYAAAAKVPTEMKAAWRESLELQQQQKGKQSTDHKPKGRHGDGLLPIKILKCLQGKTLSDVEAQMHALGVDKHLR